MSVVDRTEEYRRQASLCYELAATLSGAKAASMLRLGDSYAALAVAPDLSRPNVFAPQRYTDPLCRKCGKRMQLTFSMSGSHEGPPVQAFHCKECGETQGLTTKPAGGPVPSEQSDHAVDQHFIAASFRRASERFVPGPAVECPDAGMAIQRAELMLREDEIGGAVAFLRRVDRATGAFEAALTLRTFGEIPDGFDDAPANDPAVAAS
jgi:hypothetical protein